MDSMRHNSLHHTNKVYHFPPDSIVNQFGIINIIHYSTVLYGKNTNRITIDKLHFKMFILYRGTCRGLSCMG